jgi:hypothetical protein
MISCNHITYPPWHGSSEQAGKAEKEVGRAINAYFRRIETKVFSFEESSEALSAALEPETEELESLLILIEASSGRLGQRGPRNGKIHSFEPT